MRNAVTTAEYPAWAVAYAVAGRVGARRLCRFHDEIEFDAETAAKLPVATGAGAEMRQSLGTAVFAGMLGVTAFGLLFTPAFYTVARKIGGGKLHKDHAAPKAVAHDDAAKVHLPLAS